MWRGDFRRSLALLQHNQAWTTGPLRQERVRRGVGVADVERVLDAAAIARIKDGLQTVLARGLAEPAWVNGDDEDVHAFVERQLVAWGADSAGFAVPPQQ